MSDLQLIDKETLLEAFEENEDFLIDTIEKIIQQIPDYNQHLKDACAEKNVENLVFHAHTYKGVISNLYGERLISSLKNLEEQAASFPTDIIDQVISESDLFVSELTKLIDQLKKIVSQQSA